MGRSSSREGWPNCRGWPRPDDLRSFILSVPAGMADNASRRGLRQEIERWTHGEISAMHRLMENLPVVGTFGVVAVLFGSLARLPIDLGAWMLDRFERWLRARLASSARPREHRPREERPRSHCTGGRARRDLGGFVDGQRKIIA